jgi:hypothetical protein
MKKVVVLLVMVLAFNLSNAQSNDKVKRVKKAIERAEKQQEINDIGWLTGLKPEVRLANQKRRKVNKLAKKKVKLRLAIEKAWKKGKRLRYN